MPDWQDRVCAKGNIAPAFVDALLRSAAGDLTIPRIGGLIDFSVPAGGHTELFDFPREVDFILGKIIETKVPVPLYILWGPITGYPEVKVPFTFRDLQFVPDGHEIRYLRDLPGDVAFSRWARTNSAQQIVLSTCRDTHPYLASLAPAASPSIAPAPSAPFPPVEANSQQRKNESMEQFFARRAKRNKETAAHESKKEMESRLQRLKHAESGSVPSKKSRLYVWEKSHGHYIRRAGGRGNYEDLWEEYGPAQRRYDSFHNEWDLCDAFGPEGGIDEEYDFDDEDGGFAPYQSLPIPEDDEDVPSELLPEELEEGQLPLAQHKYQVPPNVVLDLPTAIVAKKFLGDDKNIQIGHPGEMDNFTIFLAFSKKAKSVSDIPRALLDYHDPQSEIFSAWAIQVRRETLNGQLFYVVSEIENKRGLYVLFRSASTALEIIRQRWGPELTDVVQRLLRRGIGFLYCFRSDQVPTGKPGPRNIYSGMGRRPKDWVPDQYDHQAYVAIRTQFMLSSRGRAALLHGGVIGRLAREVVPFEDVLRGPTDDATIDGICLYDGHSQYAYWDDHLTEQEIDLICGVYHVGTGWYSLLARFSS
ncbi:hypothetical protein B0H11DRAFT_1766007 [Mycena galericulata]|nr:hypothetical protein B0H11DRAFT_1766007 [Mycena galericulata]